MKANEAPEKIYLNWVNYPLEEMQVEYTRTDVFIEKAKEFLSKESNIPLWEDRGGNFGCDIPKLVEKFINYIKGE